MLTELKWQYISFLSLWVMQWYKMLWKVNKTFTAVWRFFVFSLEKVVFISRPNFFFQFPIENSNNVNDYGLNEHFVSDFSQTFHRNSEIRFVNKRSVTNSLSFFLRLPLFTLVVIFSPLMAFRYCFLAMILPRLLLE